MDAWNITRVAAAGWMHVLPGSIACRAMHKQMLFFQRQDIHALNIWWPNHQVTHSMFFSQQHVPFVVSPELSSVRDYVITHSVRSMYVVRSMCMYVVRSMCMYVVFCNIDHCIHIHWCIPMGIVHNDPWVESHMWPQQTWGQRSSRGQWPLVQVFGKKGQCIHILWCIFKSNITMIAKVCDPESRRDSWFENRLV